MNQPNRHLLKSKETAFTTDLQAASKCGFLRHNQQKRLDFNAELKFRKRSIFSRCNSDRTFALVIVSSLERTCFLQTYLLGKTHVFRKLTMYPSRLRSVMILSISTMKPYLTSLKKVVRCEPMGEVQYG